MEFARRLHDLGATIEEARAATEAYRQLLDEIVSVDSQAAWTAFELGYKSPRRLPLIDALIAAAARERDACLVHRDQQLAALPQHLIPQLDLAAEPAT